MSTLPPLRNAVGMAQSVQRLSCRLDTTGAVDIRQWSQLFPPKSVQTVCEVHPASHSRGMWAPLWISSPLYLYLPTTLKMNGVRPPDLLIISPSQGVYCNEKKKRERPPKRHVKNGARKTGLLQRDHKEEYT